MKIHYTLLFLLLFLTGIYAQSDEAIIDTLTNTTSHIEPSSSIIDTITTKEHPQLLPEHYLLTQQMLWGKYGLIRALPSLEVTEKNRIREIKWRRYMLSGHKILGYASILGMIGQAYTGVLLYKGERSYKDLHEKFAAFTNITYFTSGGLMLFAPPWRSDRAPGYSNTKTHKYLSIVHLSCMITSNILADVAEDPGFGRDMHRTTAFLAFGSFFISSVVINF